MEDSKPPPEPAGVSSLLDIDGHLVDQGKFSVPASDELDIDRCVALFNYLVAVGWMTCHGKGPEDLDELARRPSYFDSSRGEKTAGLREMLEPQITKFLEKIVMPNAEEASVFFWVRALQDEDMLSHQELFNNAVLEGKDAGRPARPRYIRLFDSAGGSGGDTMGVIYDQEKRCVAFPYFIKDVSWVLRRASYCWVPLEDLLSNWIHLLRIGKVVAEPEAAAATAEAAAEAAAEQPGKLEEGECSESKREAAPTKLSIWRWCSYGADQVQSTVDAFHTLTEEILDGMERCNLVLVGENEPLVTHAVLDAAGVPRGCFAREFLTRAKRPPFWQIAPGLSVPDDPKDFIARQKLTRTRAVRANPNLIPPVLMFYPSIGSDVLPKKDRESALPRAWQRIGLLRGRGPGDVDRAGPVSAGLYSEAVDRAEVDNAEEGFRLLLPWRSGPQARYSDRKLISGVEAQSRTELFQHGFQRLGAMGYGRAQRLERLFEHWRTMLQMKLWNVGPHGVEGGLEIFRNADEEMDWLWYSMHPSW